MRDWFGRETKNSDGGSEGRLRDRKRDITCRWWKQRSKTFVIFLANLRVFIKDTLTCRHPCWHVVNVIDRKKSLMHLMEYNEWLWTSERTDVCAVLQLRDTICGWINSTFTHQIKNLGAWRHLGNPAHTLADVVHVFLEDSCWGRTNRTQAVCVR